MKITNRLARILAPRKQVPFNDLPSWILALLGVLSFLVASYPGVMFADVIPKFVKIGNKTPFTWEFISLTFFLGLYALVAWYFGCMAARCHEVLYERWFK